MLKKYSSFIKLLSPTESNAGGIWLFLALALGLFTYSYFLSQPMRGDESFTFLTYVNGNLRSLFEYSAPNNHVLNTLLIKLSTSIFGASPASIRFPAFLAGLAAIVLTFYLSRSLDKNQKSGILAAITTAIFPYLIYYATNARGYSLVVAFTLAIAWIGNYFSNQPSRLGVFWLAFFSALGMLAIPSMILPIAGIFFWLLALLLIKRTPLKIVLRQFVLPFSILSAALTIAFYIPVIIASNGVAPIIANKFVEPQNLNDFLTQFPSHLETAFAEIVLPVPSFALYALCALVILGIIGAARTRNWGVLLILPCLFFGAAFVLLIQRATTFARTWIYLLPFILLVADAGLVFLLKQLPGRFQGSVAVALVLIGLFFAVNLISRNSIATYTDISASPEAPIMVKYLKSIFKPGDTLRVAPTANWSVRFYFWYDGMSSLLSESAPSTGRIFFVSQKSRGPLGDEAAKKFVLLLDMGNMALYQGKK